MSLAVYRAVAAALAGALQRSHRTGTAVVEWTRAASRCVGVANVFPATFCKTPCNNSIVVAKCQGREGKNAIEPFCLIFALLLITNHTRADFLKPLSACRSGVIYTTALLITEWE